jgi:simple sugar transport system ATP-binding protein
MAPILELRDITKSFPGVLANDHISLTLEKGEVHALLGENGAGKTTLMNILYGLYTPDEGQIFLDGREARIHGPNDAIAQGIGMVHQHFMLVPVMTVTENVMLGVEAVLWPYSWKGFLRFAGIVTAVLSLLQLLNLLIVGGATAGGLVLAWLASTALLLAGVAAAYGLAFLLTLMLKRGPWWFVLASVVINTLLLVVAALLFPGVRDTLFGVDAAVGRYIFGGVLLQLALVPLSYGVVDTLRSFLNRRQVAARIREISDQYGLEVDPQSYIKDLPVGVQQRVEIIKVLYRHADILILDEPTAVLTPQEADELFEIMKALLAQGKSIIFITHKLKEVLAAADRITVLRGGRVVGTTTPAQSTESSLAAMMVGREVILRVSKAERQRGESVLQMQDLCVCDDRGTQTVNGITLEVCAGEVMGIAGVQGNGQTELVEALTGLRAVEAGQVTILGQETTRAAPRAITELGVAHIPEDRQRDGLVLSFPVADNLVLNTYYLAPFARWITMQQKEIYKSADTLVNQFDVRTPSILVPASNLSGGNQQKVIVARELSRPIHLLIASQPTRGLDVGSIEYIHQQIIRKRDEGCAVFVVSSELDEILSLSDRIAVMYKGRIMDTVLASAATKEQLGLLMAGIHPGELPAPAGAAAAEGRGA